MLKRPFKSLIARIAIFALALSLVVPFVPAAFGQDGANTIEYPENGTDVVQTFVLSDQDASSGGWSVSGDDAGDFEISSDGALSFKSSPNYEDPADAGVDNTYNVTVSRSGGSLDVVVTVTNVDEAGSVSIDDLQPQAGESMGASVSDPDGSPVETAWQWSRSMDQAEWEDITGATSSTYAPKSGDAGYYLRATATYSDGLETGRDSASAESTFAVEKRPAANSQPSFPDDVEGTAGSQLTRMVRETAKAGSSIGNPVVASDTDNDPLLYSLAGVKDVDGDGDDDTYTASPEGGVTAVDPGALFKIDNKTGQISVKSDANLSLLNIEAYATTGTTAGAEGSALEYVVTITATDPSGSKATVTVTIEVMAVNEGPDITLSTTDAPPDTEITRSGDQFVVRTPEQRPLDLQDIDSETDFSGLPVFDGDDPEDMMTTR